MNLFKSLILVYALSVCFYSFKVILNENKALKLNKKILSLKEDNIDVIKDRIKPEDLIRDYTVGFGTYVDYELYRKQASLALIIANGAKAQSIKEEYICLALEGLYNALKLEPYNSNLLRSYAFNRRLIIDKKCRFIEKTSDYNEVINLALKKDPQSIRVIRDAGRIAIIDGDLDLAAKYYRQYQSLAVKRNTLVDRGVLYLISNNIKLSKLIPPNYEHIQFWIKYLEKNNPSYLSQNYESLKKLQKKTIINQRKFYNDPKMVVDRLLGLNVNVKSDEIRRFIDEELLFYLSESSFNLKDYLKIRSKLNYKKNICGLKYGDSRPEYSNLIDFGNRKSVYLDSDYMSVGCFLTENPKLIELVSKEVNHKIKSGDVDIYVSNDNYEWKLVKSLKFEKLSFPTSSVLYASFPKTTARYVKFRFNQVRVQETFYNGIQEMVNFYG